MKAKQQWWKSEQLQELLGDEKKIPPSLQSVHRTALLLYLTSTSNASFSTLRDEQIFQSTLTKTNNDVWDAKRKKEERYTFTDGKSRTSA